MIGERMEIKRGDVQVAILKLFLPFVFGGLLLAIEDFVSGERWPQVYSLMALYFVPPFGKESVIPLAIALGLHPLHIALTLASMDAITSLFVLWNFPLFSRLPLMRGVIRKVEDWSEQFFGRHSWARKLTYLSLFLFVLVPAQGSGGVSAAILGYILSLDSRRVWVVIVLASLLSCLLLAYSTKGILSILS